jgi:hypothetical protein
MGLGALALDVVGVGLSPGEREPELDAESGLESEYPCTGP